jgi:hypothetical protein
MIHTPKEFRAVLEQATEFDIQARRAVLAGNTELALRYTLSELHCVREFLARVFPAPMGPICFPGGKPVYPKTKKNPCIVLGED